MSIKETAPIVESNIVSPVVFTAEDIKVVTSSEEQIIVDAELLDSIVDAVPVLSKRIEAHPDYFMPVKQIYIGKEPYTGEYEFTPSEDLQTIEIAEKVAWRDIIINPIPSNYTDTSDADAVARDIRPGKTAYVNGVKLTGAMPWSWLGSDVESLGTLYEHEFALDDTSFPTWEASKTASSILATANVATIAANMEEYEYFLHWTCRFDAAYKSGATLKAIPYRECQDAWQSVFRRPNSAANVVASNFNSNGCVTVMTAPLLVYYNTSGNLGYTYSNSYGLYMSVQAATFSNSTSLTPTITVKRPTLNARCYDSQFAIGRKADIDDENSSFKLFCEGFRVPIGGVARTAYNNVIDLYNRT